MKKVSLFLGLFILLGMSANAQYAFKVLAAKGANEVLAGGTWTKVSAGAKVNKGEKIKLVEGGYLGLIHSSGKTFELKKSGTFIVEDLEATVIAGKSGFGAKYGSFVADGMFSANDNAANSYDRTGSVTREVEVPAINIYAPKQIKALKNEPLVLHWNDCGEHVFVITLTDFFGQVIHTQESVTNSATIDFNSIDLEVEDEMDDELKQSYLLKVQSKSNKKYTSSTGGHNYQIQLVEDVEAKTIQSSINLVKTEIDANSAIDQMVLARAYEEVGLMTYAVSTYDKAQQLAPGVEHFKLQYNEYIKAKLGLKSLKGKLDK